MNTPLFDLQETRTALDDAAVVLVPNNRMRRAMIEKISASSTVSVIRTPRIEAVDVWIRMSWQHFAQRGIEPFASTHLLDGTEEQLLWTRIVENSLSNFPLLNPQETARTLSHAYQLMKQWQLDSSSTTQLEQFSGIADVAAFLFWREKFQLLCDKQRCVNLVDAITLLIKHHQLNPIDHQVLLINFYQPPPLYAELFASLRNAEYRITVSDSELTPNSLSITRREYIDQQAEIEACAKWAAEHLKKNPDEQISIVCANKEGYESGLHEALRKALDPGSVLNLQSETHFLRERSNKSATHSGLIRDALLLLGLHNEDQEADDLCRLLRSHNVLAHEQEREARLHMEQYMRQRFSKRVSWQHFCDALNTPERNHHAPLLANALLQIRVSTRSSPKRQSAADWTKLFNQQLRIAGWPGLACSDNELQILKQWHAALEKLADASALLGKLTVVGALDALRSFCHQSGSHHSETEYPIEFYSPSEAAGLSFDHLWLLGFTDQNWPAPVTPNPFLPYELQKQAGLPGSNAEAQYQTARETLIVLHNSSRLSLTASHALTEGDQEFRASRVLSDLLGVEIPSADLSAQSDTAVENSSADANSNAIEDALDLTLPALGEVNEISGGQGVISDQAACPFRAFAKHRLNIRLLEDFENGLNARDRGSAIHEALEFLFKTIDSSEALRTLDNAQLEQLCHDAAKVATEFLYQRHRDIMTVKFRALETERIQRLLLKFLQREKERGEFKVTANEATIHWQHASLKLTLRIDRIDQLSDGSLAIIDYKTGRKITRPANWLQERSEDMQLPVYAAASANSFTEPVSTLCLAHINVEETNYTGLSAVSDFHHSLKPVEQMKELQADETDWQQLKQFFSNNVTALADEFIAGNTEVNPLNARQTCTFCGLQSLCRIGEKRHADGAAELTGDGIERSNGAVPDA